MIEFERQPVQPARPVAGYVGGKRNLARRLVALIEETPHSVYAEPFAGMGGVFLRRPTAPRVEVMNDVSQDVATLFRILQRHYQALMDMLKWQLSSRTEFERLLRQDPANLTDLERAARFLYVQRLSFGGKVKGRTFGVAPSQPARFDVTKLGAILEAAHGRLAGVWIECLPWEQFIPRWDREGTLFYVDPPYYGTEHYYGRGLFERGDFESLAEVLKGLRGTFILTLNDAPAVRDLFAWARIEEAATSYFLGESSQVARELIIRPR